MVEEAGKTKSLGCCKGTQARASEGEGEDHGAVEEVERVLKKGGEGRVRMLLDVDT